MKIEISEKEYLELLKKADKWDALDFKLSEIYGDGDYEEENEADLSDIGEICAQAFGYL